MCAHAHTHTHTHTYTCTHIHTHVHARTHTHAHTQSVSFRGAIKHQSPFMRIWSDIGSIEVFNSYTMHNTIFTCIKARLILKPWPK